MPRLLVCSTLIATLGCGPATLADSTSAAETGAGDGDGDEPGGSCVDEPIPAPAGRLEARQPVVVDLDGDGHLDVVALRPPAALELLWGDGQGGFEYAIDESFASDSGRILVGDVDGDLRLDLVGYEFGDASDNRARVRLQTSPRVFGPATVSVFPGLWDTWELMPAVLSDVDDDGDADLVIGDGLANATVNLSTALSDGLGGFAEPVSATWTMSCATKELLAADLDQSGDDELVLVHASVCAAAAASPVAVVSLDAVGEATLVSELELGSDPIPAPVIADLDGDGALDLAVATQFSTQLFRGQADGSFVPGPIVPSPAETSAVASLLAGQFDGEGGLELFTMTFADDGERLAWMIHEPLGAASSTAWGSFEAHWYMFAGDFDEDGCDDLLFARPDGGPLAQQWYLRRCPGAC